MNLINNDVMYFKDVILDTLPANFNCLQSLDLSDSHIAQIGDGLVVNGDLIISNAPLEGLPARLVVTQDLIMLDHVLPIPLDALIGGKIIVPEGEINPAIPASHIIHCDDGTDVIYRYVTIVKHEDHRPDDYDYPEILYYPHINPAKLGAARYIENNVTYTLSCMSANDGIDKVNWKRAEVAGLYTLTGLDVDEPRSVAELSKIYQICTGACVSGIKTFIEIMKVDPASTYTLRELYHMVQHYHRDRSVSKKIFLEFFAPQCIEKKKEG